MSRIAEQNDTFTSHVICTHRMSVAVVPIGLPMVSIRVPVVGPMSLRANERLRWLAGLQVSEFNAAQINDMNVWSHRDWLISTHNLIRP